MTEDEEMPEEEKPEEEIDGDELDDEELDDELDIDGEDALDDDDDVIPGDDDDEDEDSDAPAGKASGDDDEDEDEPDPDDLEEDLDTILKDRLASGDDEDDDDEDEDGAPVVPVKKPVEGDDVAPKRDGEHTCLDCFLLFSLGQVDDPAKPGVSSLRLSSSGLGSRLTDRGLVPTGEPNLRK